MTRYGMVIDTRRCIACHTCSAACKMSNNLPAGIWWNTVRTDGGEYMDTARGTYPNDLHCGYFPVNCQMCSNPACVPVCPTGATYVREDGLIEVNQEECIACMACVNACPYDVRKLYDTDLEYYVDFPLGDWDAPTHIAGAVGKCTYCANRLDRGEVPACMEFCFTRARFFGDLDDPESDVSKALEGREYIRLNEELGTEPNCYYLV